MQNWNKPNNAPVEVGDLVRSLYVGCATYGQVGIVLDRIHYDQHGEHPDCYSCRVLFDSGEAMVRARWLKTLSKNLEKEEACANL